MGELSTVRGASVFWRASFRGLLVSCGLAIAFGLMAPSAAADSYSECLAMSRQIQHFHHVKAMAKSRGDRLWQAGTEKHIAHLVQRQQRICPNYLANIEISKTKKKIREMKAFLKKAASAAARYFAFGF